MGFLVTRHIGIGAHNGSTTTVTSSFSPAANGMLVVDGKHMSTGGYTITGISDTFTGSGTWTLRETSPTIGNRVTVWVWECQLGAAPGSGTVTVTFSNSNASHRNISVTEINHTDAGTIAYVDSNSDGASVNVDPTSIVTPAYVSGNLTLGGFGGRAQSTRVPNASETDLGNFQCQAGSTHAQSNTQWALSGTQSWKTIVTSNNRWAVWFVIQYSFTASSSPRRVFVIS